MTISPVLGYPYEESFFSTQYSYLTRFRYWGTLTMDRFSVLNTLNALYTTYYPIDLNNILKHFTVSDTEKSNYSNHVTGIWD